tara:strand:+ start:1324 stop:1590 length:267 start_codon:yes stop_codon:yes gene_type:complete
MRQKNQKKQIDLVYWRATFYSAAIPDMQITIEFQAPSYTEEFDYVQLAKDALIYQVNSTELIKVKDVEPIELQEVIKNASDKSEDSNL